MVHSIMHAVVRKFVLHFSRVLLLRSGVIFMFQNTSGIIHYCSSYFFFGADGISGR
jgi:hypothetical protein